MLSREIRFGMKRTCGERPLPSSYHTARCCGLAACRIERFITGVKVVRRRLVAVKIALLKTDNFSGLRGDEAPAS